jgi:hypothetical protein
VDSSSDEYIRRRIREDYLGDSTVTILMLRKCTWSRHFVDWEISAIMRNYSRNERSGLVGITLPKLNGKWKLPDRTGANWVNNDLSKSYLAAINYGMSVKVFSMLSKLPTLSAIRARC